MPLDSEDSPSTCKPSELDMERLRSLEIDGKVESEALHACGMNMWQVFRYPLTARHKAQSWPEHYLLFYINRRGQCLQTDSLIRSEALIEFLNMA